jgi:class 3 adenylate cyclase
MNTSSTTPVRRLAAVWFADIVGYSRLAAENERAALRLVDLFESVVRAQTALGGGRVIKFIGDGALAEFASMDAAVRAAMSLRDEFAARSAAVSPATLRIGVHVGDVVQRSDGDLHGDGVNIASRLQAEAAPGQVVVSEDDWHQLRQHPEYPYEALGERELRGISARIGVFGIVGVDRVEDAEPQAALPALDPGALAERLPPPPHASPRGGWPRSLLYTGLAGLGVLALAALLLTRHLRPPAAAEGGGTPPAQAAPAGDRSRTSSRSRARSRSGSPEPSWPSSAPRRGRAWSAGPPAI